MAEVPEINESEKDTDIIFQSINKQLSIWILAALSLPMVALGIIAILYLTDIDGYIDMALISIVCIFFTVSVIWWWWSANTILRLSNTLLEATKSLKTTKNILTELRKRMR